LERDDSLENGFDGEIPPISSKETGHINWGCHDAKKHCTEHQSFSGLCPVSGNHQQNQRPLTQKYNKEPLNNEQGRGKNNPCNSLPGESEFRIRITVFMWLNHSQYKVG
jgi:hypothetical protein